MGNLLIGVTANQKRKVDLWQSAGRKPVQQFRMVKKKQCIIPYVTHNNVTQLNKCNKQLSNRMIQ